MAHKIFTCILFVLFVAVSITLYKTDKKYSKLKVEIEKKQNLIISQQTYINQNNAFHEATIKKNLEVLKFPKVKSDEINIFKKKIILNTFKNENQLVRGINNSFPGSAYLEIFNDDLFIVSATGIIGRASLKDQNTLRFNQIKNNINNFLTLGEINKGNWFSVKDILIFQNKVFVSYTNEKKKDCWNTSIIYADYNLDYLNFEKFFEPANCVLSKGNIDNEFNAHQSGGKLFKFDEENIIFSLGDFRLRKLAQEDNTPFGKIVKINIYKLNHEILSKGHRNPQGLLYNKKNDFIISTEHGPHGGDEINLNLNTRKNVKNFGWPVSSYGEHYGGKDSIANKTKYEKYPLHKSHTDYGFIEPLKYFVPSIGISQIIEVNNKNFIFSSLKDRAIYTFTLSKEFKLENLRRIEIGERIRDMIYEKKQKQVLLFLEDTASIGKFTLE